jgi:hypothetical protein
LRLAQPGHPHLSRRRRRRLFDDSRRSPFGDDDGFDRRFGLGSWRFGFENRLRSLRNALARSLIT